MILKSMGKRGISKASLEACVNSRTLSARWLALRAREREEWELRQLARGRPHAYADFWWPASCPLSLPLARDVQCEYHSVPHCLKAPILLISIIINVSVRDAIRKHSEMITPFLRSPQQQQT